MAINKCKCLYVYSVSKFGENFKYFDKYLTRWEPRRLNEEFEGNGKFIRKEKWRGKGEEERKYLILLNVEEGRKRKAFIWEE